MRLHRDGVSLDYSDDGRGLPVVLIHGFGNDRAMWRPQVEAFKDRYRVVAVDLRGFGGSTGADGEAISMDQYADDLATLLDHLKVRSAVVGGISLGGYVALAFALRHAHRTAGLVLANTRAGADNPDWKAFREEMVRGIEARGAESIVESYGGKPLRPDAPPQVLEAMQAMIRRQGKPGLMSGVRGMAQRPDRTSALASLRIPTLIIHGSADAYIPPSEAEAMHRGIAGSTYVNIPGAGHLSNMDTPGAFNAALEAFLRPLARAWKP